MYYTKFVILEGVLPILKYIMDRVGDFDVGYFVNELAAASKNLGILEAKIDSYQFNSILIPMLQKKRRFPRCILRELKQP